MPVLGREASDPRFQLSGGAGDHQEVVCVFIRLFYFKVLISDTEENRVAIVLALICP